MWEAVILQVPDFPEVWMPSSPTSGRCSDRQDPGVVGDREPGAESLAGAELLTAQVDRRQNVSSNVVLTPGPVSVGFWKNGAWTKAQDRAGHRQGSHFQGQRPTERGHGPELRVLRASMRSPASLGAGPSSRSVWGNAS